MRRSVQRLLTGGAAGAIATAVMTVVMLAGERAGLLPGPPPELIVQHALPKLERRTRRGLALLLHLGYGAAGGAAGACIAPRHLRRPAVGVAYGLLLWVVGYEGWVPLMGVLPRAHRDVPSRVGTMITAHIVYGATTSLVLRAMRLHDDP